MKYLFIALALVLCVAANAQDKEVDHSYKPLKLSLNEDGDKYVRFIMWHQIWGSTQNLSDEDADFMFSPSIRRSRYLAFAQISPKFLILTHFGLNSLSTANLTSLGGNGDAPQMFLHDAWGELKVVDQLYVGAGLHYWKGMTRLSNASTLNFMTLDQPRPFVHWHSLGNTDQFARHLGFYAKGTIGESFQYRIAANQRLAMDNSLGAGYSYSQDTVDVCTIAMRGSGNAVYEGYFEYQLWDKESNKLPFKVGTYMGKKKILNVGAGFYAMPNAGLDLVDSTENSVMHFAGDVFCEMPMEFGAIHGYLSFMSFDYGERYVARWAGTGSNIYVQAGGYLKNLKIMPYVAYQMGNYDGNPDPTTSMNAGVNYYINGHFAKLTLEYHAITNQLGTGTDASQIRLQMHVFL